MRSCLYVGHVRHRRFVPKSHNFTHPLFMVCLDLAELDSVFAERWLWSIDKPNLATFNRSNYFGDPAITIDQAIRDFVAAKTGTIPTGPIRLLTHLRYLGFSFNPVVFITASTPREGMSKPLSRRSPIPLGTNAIAMC